MTPIFVVIPVKDQLHYTKGLVEQILRQGEATCTLLLDNGSTDGTYEWAARRMGKTGKLVIEHADGLFLHAMWNRGLDWAKSESPTQEHSVAILNNDLHIGWRFLSRLNRGLRLSDHIGVAGANYDGRRFPADSLAMEVRDICGDRYDGSGGLPGFAFMLKGEQAYRFPEELHWWYGDNDMVLTMAKQQRMCVLVRDAVCEHLDRGTRKQPRKREGETWVNGDWMSQLDPERRRQIESDRKWFEKKWL